MRTYGHARTHEDIPGEVLLSLDSYHLDAAHEMSPALYVLPLALALACLVLGAWRLLLRGIRI